MKRLLLGAVCFVQCFSVRAGLLGNEAESKHMGLKSFIASVSPNDFALLPDRIDEYAKAFNKEAVALGAFLKEKIDDYNKVRRSSIEVASLKNRQLIKQLEAQLAEKSEKIESDIKKIQQSRFTKKEKRLALDLYKQAIDKLKSASQALQRVIFVKPMLDEDITHIQNQARTFAGKDFASFQAQLKNDKETWEKIAGQVMLEKDGIGNKADLIELARAVSRMDKDAIAEYRKKAMTFQKPTTVYGAILNAIAQNLLIQSR